MDVAQQPAYRPQPGDLERKLADCFPDEGLRVAARAQVMRYGRQTWHHEVDRVRLAILKIAAGDLLAIDKTVALAEEDFRAVLTKAEYPAYSQLGPGIDSTSRTAQAAIAADKAQYRKWIQGR
jgi:hypothetical protein